MIQIILQILSVIGIILLIILGLILLLTGLVLLVPVRYEARLRKDENLFCFLKVHWLLHFLTLRYEYPERKAVIVKVAGITVYDSGKPKQPKEPKNKKKKKKEAEPAPEDVLETLPKPSEEDIKEKEKEPEVQEEAFYTENKKKPKKKKKNIFRKIIDFFKKLKYTIQHFYDTMKHVKDNIEYYITVLKEEQTLALLKNGKKRLIKIIKLLLPKKLQADILFGTGSPDTTGYVLGVYGMLLPYLGNHVNITPDFENPVFQGNIWAKGKIRLVTFIVHILCVVCDSNFKPVINKLKREA